MNSTSEYLCKESKSTNLKSYLDPHAFAMLFTIANIWKQSKCPSVNEWTKMQCVYIYHTHIPPPQHTHSVESYSAMRKKTIMPFTTMDASRWHYAK